MKRVRMTSEFEKTAAYQSLPALRIPAGWAIGWNTLNTIDRAEEGHFGGSSVFNATNEGRRFNIDVAFTPEFDPDGAFVLTVINQPWPRTPLGRRRDAPLRFDADAETVHTSASKTFPDIVAEIETWIARCTVWAREQN